MPCGRAAEVGRHARAAATVTPAPAQPRRRPSRAQLGPGCRREPRPRLVGSAPSRSASSPSWSAVSSAEWFCGWPSMARPWPFTVYAKITVGRLSSMAANASPSAPRSCPPRSRTAAGSCVVGDAGQQLGDAGGVRAARRAAGPAARPAVAAQQPLVLGVGHVVDPVAQRGAARPGEQLLQQPAVLDREHLPAGRREHALQPAAPHVGHHPVQRLPVEVHDPDDLAQLGHVGSRTASQTAPSSSSASPTSEYCRPGPRAAEVPGDVPAGQRTPDRRGRADADRAGGVVDRVRVLGPARVALQPAERPQRRQVGSSSSPSR